MLIASQANAAERFGIDQYLALQSVSEISASPDGRYVAYTVTAADLEKDKYLSSVWVQPVAGGPPLRMSSKDSSSSSPRWSPDGRYLAVLSDRTDETTQVWLYDLRGGDAQQLTEFKQGIDDFRWSPDGKRMLLVAEDPTPADLDEEDPPNPRPWVIDRLQFKQDYVGYLDRYRSHIHVLEMADRATRQVTFGDYEDGEPAWAPDSRRIVFVSNRTEHPDRNRNTDLWIIDTAGEGGKLRQLTTAATADASPAFSPDGKTVVYTTTTPDSLPIYAIPELATIDVASGEVRMIEALRETQALAPRFSVGGSSLLAMTEYRGEQRLVRVDADSGAVRSEVEGRDVVREFDVAADGRLFALVSRPQLPGEVFAVGQDGLRQLTFANAAILDGIELADMEKHTYRSKDGTAVDTFVLFPPGYRKGRAYPGILQIHGGPQSQFDYGFRTEAHLLAARGFVVVMPNPRGSFGYGQAFAEAIYRDWGGIDYEDVIASMDFAVEQGWVDEDRMAVYGWSYGGMMTNHVITRTDRFDAAITGASATLYMVNYGHDQYQRWWEEELGLPWKAENREYWDSISPFFRLDEVTTPTLIVGGERDWNVPIINSEQLYIALKRRGIPAELIVYPNEGHSLSVPSYERHLYENYFAWLEHFVTPGRR